MGSVSKEMVAKRYQDIIDVLDMHGTMSIDAISKVVESPYHTVRRDINELRSQGKTLPVRKDGQTVYWALKGHSVIPSLLGNSGYVPYTQVMRIALDKGRLFHYPTGRIETVLAYLYAQPILAAVGGEIKHNELMYMRGVIDEAISTLDDHRRMLMDLKGRVFTDSVAEFESWAKDNQYDKELAINVLFKFVPEDTIPHQPYQEALSQEALSHEG